jgi:malate dehydrogenase (oxaloacetate-decarboxylating)(NADP+)
LNIKKKDALACHGGGRPGKVQADTALVFPDQQGGNITYKVLHHIGRAETIGPMLMEMRKPVHVLQRGDDVEDIVSMVAICAVDAQEAGC